MKILFSPTKLAHLKNAHTLERIIREMTEPGLGAELLVNIRCPTGEIRLIVISEGRRRVWMAQPRGWLHGELSDAAIRTVVDELFESVRASCSCLEDARA